MKPAHPTLHPGASAGAKSAGAASSAAPAAPGAGAELGVEWTDPPRWKRVKPRSRMRKASYEIPAKSGDSKPAEMSVFYFGASQGGGVEDNLTRWAGQFTGVDPKAVTKNKRVVGSLTQHTIEISSGTFSGGMGAAPGQVPYGLLGAVVEAPSGKYFFKLTGPAKTVKAAKVEFDGLLSGMKARGK